MLANIDEWISMEDSANCVADGVKLKTAWMKELCRETEFPYDMDNTANIMRNFRFNKDGPRDALHFRDECFVSIFTGRRGVKPTIRFMDAFDDSVEGYLTRGRWREEEEEGEEQK